MRKLFPITAALGMATVLTRRDVPTRGLRGAVEVDAGAHGDGELVQQRATLDGLAAEPQEKRAGDVRVGVGRGGVGCGR